MVECYSFPSQNEVFMSVQTVMWPELEIQKIERDLSKIQRKLFAEQTAMAKEMESLEGHVHELTDAVMKLIQIVEQRK